MVVLFITVSPVVSTPVKLTPVAPVRPVPVSVTGVPGRPLAGEKVRLGVRVNVWLLGALTPPVVVTVSGPVWAPGGTKMPVMLVPAPFTVKPVVPPVLPVPVKVMAVVPVRLVPVRLRVVPIGPLVGVKEVIVGGRSTSRPRKSVLAPAGLASVRLLNVAGGVV